MTAAGRKIALSAHIEIEWLTGRTARALCPSCGVAGEVQQILDIDYRPPVEHDDEHRFILQICPACSARFVDNMKMMEFHSAQQVERGEDAFHVQLGAGIWPITGQLARLDKPRGAKVLEVGGAFGFGLDFCLRAKGWDGVGYDPSPFAAVGMRELDLPLRQEYFTARHLTLGPWDVAVATELLEHISYPAAFLLLMRQALGETGVLMLSTPNAACVTPEQPVANLLPLLSPGSHTVLQTAKSLELALRAAGFAHTHIIADGLSLVAYASAARIDLLEDEVARRAMYRRYLVERAGLAGLTSDLRLGFAGRGIFEAVNDGDWPAADAAWAALLPAVQARFGLALEEMTALPAQATTASLAELAQLMPLGLGMIMFGRAMRLLKQGERRTDVEPVLRLALRAIEVLLRALAEHSLQDALSASMAELLREELLICDAAAGRVEVVAGLAGFGVEATSWRGFVELVNAGAIEVAGALRETLPELPGAEIPPGLRRNALLSLVNFYLAPGGDALLALPGVAALRQTGETADEAVLGVFTRLVNAGRYDAAARLAAEETLLQALEGVAGAAAEDARWAELMLDLQRAPLRAARVAAARLAAGGDAARLSVVYVDGFIRLANAGDAAAARELQDGLDARLGFCPPAARRDALTALTLLEAQPGGRPENVAGRLAALRADGADEAVLTGLALQAFAMLVNQAAYAPARLLLPVVDPALIKLRPPFDACARDALFAAGMLFLQAKEDWRRSAASFARLRDALVKQTAPGGPADPLFWSALRGEVIALHQLNRGADATLLLRGFLDAYPGAPEDLRAQLKGSKRA
jgi:2-polyprenyl-3-methyl-5-hydroxy-6-metoxy-1,4-benzoquinol methylase